MPVKRKKQSGISDGQFSMSLRGGRHITPLFQQSTWRPPALGSLPSWKGVKRIGIDTETKDEYLSALGPGVRRGARMIGISFAIEDGPKHYLPFGHEDAEDNLPASNVLGYIREQFKDFDGEVVGANLPYDLDHLWQAGVKMPMVSRYCDVQVADPLIWEHHMSYSLDNIALRRGLAGKSEELLRRAAEELRCDPKTDMWRFSARYVGQYAEDDALLPLQILRKQEKEMDDMELMGAWDMECRLLPVLVRMTRRGVRVDVDRLSRVERWCLDQQRECSAIITRESGVRWPDAGSVDTKTVEMLAQSLGIVLGVTRTGKVSTAADAFTGVDHPAAKAYLGYAKAKTFQTTFVNGTREHLTGKPGQERMHCTFNQIRKTDDDDKQSGVKYGRLSSSHVNMQNQPSASRSPPGDCTGHMWRSIYKPEEGEVWCANDLKQQEPKWTYDLAMRSKLDGAEKVIQMFRDNPMMDSYVPIVEMTGVTRGTAKIVWLSYTYGKSDGNLCHTDPPFGLGLGDECYRACWDKERWCHEPVESDRGSMLAARGALVYWRPGPKGQDIINKINAGMPFLKELQKLAARKANENGYILLDSKRRCNFERMDSGEIWNGHAALNRRVQGQASEQTKQIMLAVVDAGYDETLKLQVHDELDHSVPNEVTGKAIAEVMRTAVPMLVPTIIDSEFGPSWGESMGFEQHGPDGKVFKGPYAWSERMS